MTYIGIDPGLSGAIARIMPNGDVCIVDVPTRTVDKKGKTKSGKNKTQNVYDVPGMVSIFEGFAHDYGTNNIHLFIEKSQPMPDQGVVSVFGYGKGYGIYLGIFAALKIPYTEIHPMTWRKIVMRDMPREKDASIIRAKQLYPNADITLKRHHGRSEALLIAHYGKITTGGQNCG